MKYVPKRKGDMPRILWDTNRDARKYIHDLQCNCRTGPRNVPSHRILHMSLYPQKGKRGMGVPALSCSPQRNTRVRITRVIE